MNKCTTSPNDISELERLRNSHAALVEALKQTRADMAKFAKDANYPNTVGPWLARIDAALEAVK